MRATIVTETYFPQVNGVSRTLGQLVRVLRAEGNHVQLVHPQYGEPATDSVHLVRARSLPFYKELHLPLPPFGSTWRAIDAFRPDIVHIATEATLGLATLHYCRRREIPTVSSFHTNFDMYADHYRVGFIRPTIWRYLRWFHNRTLATFVPSRATIADLEARGFERLELWPRGVDATVFRPDRPGRERVRGALGFGPDDVVIGHVSRIAAEKNVGYLGAALEKVAETRPSAKVLIVGDGPARPELERRLPGARFVGYKTGEDLADHYAAADLFAFASRTETFGNVILEAMASGLPVVAVAEGGPIDIVDEGVTGHLVAPGAGVSAFVDALVRLVDDGLSRRAMAASARAYAERQSWDAIMHRLGARYAEILKSSRGE